MCLLDFCPTVTKCCFCVENLQTATIIISLLSLGAGITSFVSNVMELTNPDPDAMVKFTGAYKETIPGLMIFFSIVLLVGSVLLMMGALSSNALFVTIYEWCAMLFLVFTGGFHLIINIMIMNEEGGVVLGLALTFTCVLAFLLFLYFVVVVHSYRKTIE